MTEPKPKTELRKKDFRDRWDRLFVKNQDSMHVLTPYLFPRRCDNEAVLNKVFDLTAVDEFLARKNAENPAFKYTIFHIVCAAVAKCIMLKPKMNYFYSGRRLFERRFIELAFVVKRKVNEESEESLATFRVDKEGGSLVEQVHSFVEDFVTKVRVKGQNEDISNKMDIMRLMPRPIMKFLFFILRRLEYHGIYPKGLMKGDPCYSTVFITNLGSIKMNADYHHTYEWGTGSFFIVVNQRKMRPLFKDDGSYEMKDTLKMSFTIDERIADGFYFAKAIKLLDYLLQHPDLLDLDAATPVEVEF
jgi:hypothetical protein